MFYNIHADPRVNAAIEHAHEMRAAAIRGYIAHAGHAFAAGVRALASAVKPTRHA